VVDKAHKVMDDWNAVNVVLDQSRQQQGHPPTMVSAPQPAMIRWHKLQPGRLMCNICV